MNKPKQNLTLEVSVVFCQFVRIVLLICSSFFIDLPLKYKKYGLSGMNKVGINTATTIQVMSVFIAIYDMNGPIPNIINMPIADIICVIAPEAPLISFCNFYRYILEVLIIVVCFQSTRHI